MNKTKQNDDCAHHEVTSNDNNESMTPTRLEGK